MIPFAALMMAGYGGLSDWLSCIATGSICADGSVRMSISSEVSFEEKADSTEIWLVSRAEMLRRAFVTGWIFSGVWHQRRTC